MPYLNTVSVSMFSIVLQQWSAQYVVNRNNNFVGANVVLDNSSIGAVDRNNLKITKGRNLISDKLLCRWLLKIYLLNLREPERVLACLCLINVLFEQEH